MITKICIRGNNLIVINNVIADNGKEDTSEI